MVSLLQDTNLANEVAFKNCATFTKCIKKTDGATKNDAADLDVVMLIYHLLEYSSNYLDTTGSLRFYSKYEATDFNVVDDNAFKSIKCKAKLLGDTKDDGANEISKDTTIAVPLKYLSNSWRWFEIAGDCLKLQS